MNVKTFGLAAVGALLVTGCSSKEQGPFVAVIPPLAFTRFISAVPDTQSTDFRFIDQLEYSPYSLAVPFRGFSPYQGTAPGARHLRVFMTHTQSGAIPWNNINEVSKMLIDTTLTFEAGKYYTLLHLGSARAAEGSPEANRIEVFQDDCGTVGTSSVAFRVINAGTGLNALDVFATAATADATPATALVSNLAFRAASPYAARTTGTTALRFFAAGTTTPTLANVAAPAGAPKGTAADPNATAIGGAGQGQSCLTALLVPRSTAGSSAANFTTPNILYVVDRHPPR